MNVYTKIKYKYLHYRVWVNTNIYKINYLIKILF